jgi:hypothetical protein
MKTIAEVASFIVRTTLENDGIAPKTIALSSEDYEAFRKEFAQYQGPMQVLGVPIEKAA